MDIAKQKYREKLVDKMANPQITCKEYWKIKKQIFGDKVAHGIPPLNISGTIMCDDKEKANAFAQYFASQSQAPQVQTTILQTHTEQRVTFQVPTITVEEVQNILESLNISKANGPDNISNRILKFHANALAPSLAALINHSLSLGKFPDAWKLANIIPLFKKGDKQNVKNYRPVSLLSNIGKVMEKIVCKKLYEYCMKYGFLTWRNAGFKRNEGTINQLVYLTNTIYQNLNEGKDTAMVFLDASKAFDRIWHEGLLWKLENIGMCEPMCHWFKSYLNNRKICTVINGMPSDWYHTSSGVPQGSILGPLLFLIYVNDIVDKIDCEILLYADDTSLVHSFDQNNMSYAFDKLNSDLTKLTDWANKWFMDFNATKSEYVVFTNKKNMNYPDLIMGYQNITRVSDHTHLGLTRQQNA